MQKADWAAVIKAVDGCDLQKVSFDSVISDGATGVPEGVAIPYVSFVAQCPDGNAAVATGDEGGITPYYSSVGGCSTISGPGSLCLYTDPYSGSSTGWGIFDSYTYTGSGTVSGHTSLSIRSTTACVVGTGGANSFTATLGNNGQVGLVYPWTISARWTATFWGWRGTDPLTNWGNRCDAF